MITQIDSLIAPDEKILRDARTHEIVFLKPFLAITFALIVAIFFHPIVGGAILVMSIYPVYVSIVNYITTHVILTDQKVMVRTGYLSRDWVQLPIERVETAYLAEPIIGRVFGYSTVIITGIGSGTLAIPQLVGGDAIIRELQERLTHQNRTVELQIEGERFERVRRQAAF